MTTTYAYDYQNHLTSLKNQTESAGIISQYSSEYLVNGQKSKETADTMDEDGKKSKKTATYTYDLLGRITKETKTGSEDISYTYDSNNNRKEMTVGNKVTAYKYNKNDELLRTDTLNTDTEEDSVVIYKNDRNGNQLATVNRYEIPSDQKDSTYVDIDVTLGDNRLNENVVNYYNALNQLTKNYKVSFTYDAEGLRTSKTVNGEKTVFVWDGDQLVVELSESGKVQKRYVRGNDLVYADKGNNTEKQYYVTDPHGNVVQLTDESGKVTKTYEYDSFGNEVNPDSKDDNPFRYCEEYYDKETEEVYLRARYYQPEVGRFLTRDTYTGEEDEPRSLHLYTYCKNDGVNYVDPTGNDALAIWASSAWWLCGLDGPLPIGDAIYGVGLVVAGVATVAVADDVSKKISEDRSISRSYIKKTYISNTINTRRKIVPRHMTITTQNPISRTRITSKLIIRSPKVIYKSGKRYYRYTINTNHLTKQELDRELSKINKATRKSNKKNGRNKKPRSKYPPARRFRFKSRKGAYQAAKKAGRGKEPIHHPKGGGQDGHYHPNVKNEHRITPKIPSSHDHYYYPK